MPRNGSGTYALPVNSWNPATNGTLATTADWQSLINDVATAVTNSVAKDGQTVMTGSLNMGGFNLSNVASAAITALSGPTTAPTAAPGTNTTQIATTAHVFAERTNPATLTNKTLTAPVINSPTGLVKADVGLGNVDNTSDANKPVSTATQTALNGKQDLDADLTALAGLATTGLIARTSAGAAATRTLTAGAGVTITNGDGIAGNPTIAVSGGVGLGDVLGPVSSNDNAIARYDSTTGKVLQNSAVTVGDAGEVAGIASMNGGQLAGLRNKIINGKMEIAQRGPSFPAILNALYSLDRWRTSFVTSAVMTVSQQSDVPSGNEFQASIRATITTADASIAAGDFALIDQSIEGYNVRDLIGRNFTLSFLVRSSKTGVHCVALRNGGGDRSYVAEYTINTANTWEQKSITVNGGVPTAGTWDWTTGAGLLVRFTLAAGSTFHTTANAWQTGSFLATSSQVNCLDTVGNIFAITGVQLEVGSVATPFEHRPFGMELALCQRYYTRQTPTAADQTLGVGHNTSTTAAVATATFPVQMRSAPTALEQSGTAGDYSVAHAATSTVCSAVPTLLTASPFAATTTFTVASGLTAGQGSRARAVNTSAYLAWSAEL